MAVFSNRAIVLRGIRGEAEAFEAYLNRRIMLERSFERLEQAAQKFVNDIIKLEREFDADEVRRSVQNG